MSPAAPAGASLGDLLAWTPEVLRTESTVLEAAGNHLDNAVSRVDRILSQLPTVWSGRAADAVRGALRTERDNIAAYRQDVSGLRRAYHAAHEDMSSCHTALREAVRNAESAGFSVPRDAEASASVTVIAPSRGAGAAGEAGAAGGGPAAGEAGETGNAAAAELAARRHAEAIAAAVGSLLRADGEHGRALDALAEAATRGDVPAAREEAIDAAGEEHDLTASRYPSVPGIGARGNEALHDAAGLTPVVGTVLEVHEGLLAVEENRLSPGEVVLHALGARAVDHVTEFAGAGLRIVGAETGGKWVGRYAGAKGLGGMVDGVLDATVLPAGRWADEEMGTELFGPTDAGLTARALRDAERFGG